jgi:hypothetical protein
MRKKKPQGTPKSTTLRVFTKRNTNEEVNGIASERDSVHPNTKQQQTGQSVPAPSVSNEHEDNMIRVVTVVGQIMRELKGAASEKAKIMAITNIVYYLFQEDDK